LIGDFDRLVLVLPFLLLFNSYGLVFFRFEISINGVDFFLYVTLGFFSFCTVDLALEAIIFGCCFAALCF